MGYASVLETSRNVAKCLYERLLPMVTIDKVADQDVQQDDEDSSEGVQEEEEPRPARKSLGHESTEPSDKVEEEE